MLERKVTIKNVSHATVIYKIENLNFKRILKGENSIIKVPFDVAYEGLSEECVYNLFSRGYLIVVDKQDRIDLGLETEEEVSMSECIMSSEEILKLLQENNPIKIKETFEQIPATQREKIAQVAIENDIYNAGLAKFVKDYTGIDLLKNIQDRKIDLEDN